MSFQQAHQIQTCLLEQSRYGLSDILSPKQHLNELEIA